MAYGSTWPSTEGNAIAALIVAIGSFVVCPGIAAIIALVLAGSAKRSILRSAGAREGLGIVLAARIIAWANIALLALVIVAVVIGLAAWHTGSGVSTGS